MKSPTVGLMYDEKVNVLLISNGCKKKLDGSTVRSSRSSLLIRLLRTALEHLQDLRRNAGEVDNNDTHVLHKYIRVQVGLVKG